MSSFKKAFGSRLKQLRKLNNYTQEKLADKININLRQLARIEAGESFVTAETIEKLCLVFNIAPSVLFDFEIIDDTKMTGTGTTVHFCVVKEGNVIHLVNKKEASKTVKEYSPKYSTTNDLDERMLSLAQNIGRDIIVDEYKDGNVFATKTYTPTGRLDISYTNSLNKDLSTLKENINKISNDNKKIKFINLAFNALHSSDSRQQLRMVMDGMELIK